MTYKIKGTGDVRSVMDGSRLVGRIHRKERQQESVSFNFERGTGRYSVRAVVSWVGTRGDTDEPVLDAGGNRRLVFDTMKSWTKIWPWEAR